MGGVDLWQNEDETNDNFDPQSMHDKILEVVSISGTWHLGKLQVEPYPQQRFPVYISICYCKSFYPWCRNCSYCCLLLILL